MENTAFHTHGSEDVPILSKVLSCEKYLCGYHLLYTLLEKVDVEHITEYLIFAELENGSQDNVTCELGAGIERAIKFFLLVSDNCVMPSTLEDVLQDFDCSELINV